MQARRPFSSVFPVTAVDENQWFEGWFEARGTGAPFPNLWPVTPLPPLEQFFVSPGGGVLVPPGCLGWAYCEGRCYVRCVSKPPFPNTSLAE